LFWSLEVFLFPMVRNYCFDCAFQLIVMLVMKSRFIYHYKINNGVLCIDTGRLEWAQHRLEEGLVSRFEHFSRQCNLISWSDYSETPRVPLRNKLHTFTRNIYIYICETIGKHVHVPNRTLHDTKLCVHNRLSHTHIKMWYTSILRHVHHLELYSHRTVCTPDNHILVI